MKIRAVKLCFCLAGCAVLTFAFAQNDEVDSASVLEKYQAEINRNIVSANIDSSNDFSDVVNAASAVFQSHFGVAGNPDFPPTIKFGSSRSLHKNDVSPEFPRNVSGLSAKFSLAGDDLFQTDLPLTFFGHATKTGDVESISLSPSGKRYEFLVGKQNADGTLTFKKAERSLCITCHQSEGPVLSRAGWMESESNDALAVIGNKMNNKRAYDAFVLSVKQSNPSLLENIPSVTAFKLGEESIENDLREFLQKNHTNAELIADIMKPVHRVESHSFFQRHDSSIIFALDNKVRSANKVLQTFQVCNHICEDNDSCNRALLALAITGSLSPEENKNLVKYVSAQWPKSNFVQRSSVLPDVNPLRGPDGGTTSLYNIQNRDGVFKILQNSFSSDSQSLRDKEDIWAINNNVNLAYVESRTTQDVGSPPDAKESLSKYVQEVTQPARVAGSGADPKLPRPYINPIEPEDLSALGRRFVSCFGLFPKDLASIETVDPTTLRKIIFSSPRLLGIRADRAHIGSQVAAKIQSAIHDEELKLKKSLAINPDLLPRTAEDGNRIVPKWSYGPTHSSANRPTNQAATESPFTPAQKAQALTIFKRSCSECHFHDDSDYKLPLEDLDKMKGYRSKDGDSAYTLLRDNVMPPEGSLSGISESERVFLMRATASQSLDLKDEPQGQTH